MNLQATRAISWGNQDVEKHTLPMMSFEIGLNPFLPQSLNAQSLHTALS